MNKWFLAAREGDLETLKRLAGTVDDIHAQDEFGRSAFHNITMYGHSIACMQLLLDVNADVNAKTRMEYTPLAFASGGGDVENVRFLLEKKADVNARVGVVGESALHIAVQRTFVDVVELLLRSKANVDAVTIGGESPLLYAVHWRHKLCAEVLLDHGAVCDAKYIHENNPWVAAIRQKHQRCRSAAMEAYAVYYYYLKMPRDLARMLARRVWDTRFDQRWETNE